MVRTVISLEESEKAWLDRQAEDQRVSMAELIRKAVRRYREEMERDEESVEQLLEKTSGIWEGEDGLTYQRRLREEWDR